MPRAAPRQARHRGARRPNGGAPLARRPHPAPRVCVGPPLRCGACCGLDRRVVALVASYGVVRPPGAVSEDPVCEVSVPALPPRCRQGPVPAGSSCAPRPLLSSSGGAAHAPRRPPADARHSGAFSRCSELGRRRRHCFRAVSSLQEHWSVTPLSPLPPAAGRRPLFWLCGVAYSEYFMWSHSACALHGWLLALGVISRFTHVVACVQCFIPPVN